MSGRKTSKGRSTTGRGSKKKSAAKRPATRRAVKKPARRPTTAKKRPARRKATARNKARPAKPLLARIGSLTLRGMAVAFVVLAAGLVGLIIYAQDLPPIDDLANARKDPRLVIKSEEGEILGIRGQDRGEPVNAADLPPHVVHAFLATEDRNFYHHVGVNPVAILRALFVNLQAGDVEQGGSTITQQLVKNLLLTPERSMQRKVQEMLLALKIEAKYDKNEIFSLYLNAVYFGNGAYGLEAAARRYYEKDPQELTLGEAALLAGLLKAPSRFAPTADEEAAIARAKVVLTSMVEAGYITQEEAAAAKYGRLKKAGAADTAGAYAADYAVAEAKRLIGPITRDVIIHTTIDAAATRRTELARQAVAAEYPLYTEEVQSALVVLDENGAIHVLIGGNDYADTPYNRAVRATRQPGSVFKPFVYLAALEEGFRPEDLVDDSRVAVGDWQPANYKDTYAGMVPLSEAMARSLNAAAIRLQEEVGRERVVATANRLGLGISDPGPSLALGVTEVTPLDLAAAYLPFSGGGIPATPYLVDTIESPDSEILYTHIPEIPDGPVVSREVLTAFDHMMREVVTAGSGRRASIEGHFAAGKTGTSQNSRDAWFAGYASGLVGVVWLGRDDDRPMELGRRYMSGSRAPASLWSGMMTAALDGVEPREPTLYEPEERPDTLLEHLAMLLGMPPGKDKSPPKPDPYDDEIAAFIRAAGEGR